MDVCATVTVKLPSRKKRAFLESTLSSAVPHDSAQPRSLAPESTAPLGPFLAASPSWIPKSFPWASRERAKAQICFFLGLHTDMWEKQLIMLSSRYKEMGTCDREWGTAQLAGRGEVHGGGMPSPVLGRALDTQG